MRVYLFHEDASKPEAYLPHHLPPLLHVEAALDALLAGDAQNLRPSSAAFIKTSPATLAHEKNLLEVNLIRRILNCVPTNRLFSLFLFFGCSKKWSRFSGVKTENFCKGRILADFGDIWRVFGEILPLQNSMEKPRKNQEKTTETIGKPIKTYFSLFFCSFSLF